MQSCTAIVKEEVIEPKMEPLSPLLTPPPATSPTVAPAEQPTIQPAPTQPAPFIKPEYSLVPVRSGVPIYHLVHQGPAPPGWETDPAWQNNKFDIDEPIFFKNEYFRLRHNANN